MILLLAIMSLLQISLAQEHAPTRPGNKPDVYCIELYNNFAGQCRSAHAEGHGILRLLTGAARKYGCFQAEYSDPRQTAFYRAVEFDEQRLAGNTPPIHEEFQDAVDDVLLQVLHPIGPGETLWTRLKEVSEHVREPALHTSAETLSRALKALSTVPFGSLDFLDDPRFIDALEFLPLFDPEPISPLQNVCGFFVDRHPSYWYQPRLGILQTLLTLSVAGWAEKMPQELPSATKNFAKKLFALDPNAWSFPLVAQALTLSGRFQQFHAHVLLDEALGMSPNGALPMPYPGWSYTQRSESEITLTIPGRCELAPAADTALPIVIGINRLKVLEKQRAFVRKQGFENDFKILKAEFDLTKGSTAISVSVKQNQDFVMGVTCYGRRLYLGVSKNVFSEEKDRDTLYITNLLRTNRPPVSRRLRANLRSRSEWDPVRDESIWKNLITFTETVSKDARDGHENASYVRTECPSLNSLIDSKYKPSISAFVAPFLIENLDHPCAALAALRAPREIQPILVAMLYKTDPPETAENAALALYRPELLPKRLRRFVAERMLKEGADKRPGQDSKDTTVRDLARLLPHAEKEALVLKSAGQHRYVTKLASELGIWTPEIIEKMKVEEFDSTEYGLWIGKIAELHRKELFLPIVKKHFAVDPKKDFYLRDLDIASIAVSGTPVPELTPALIEVCENHPMTEGPPRLLAVNAKAGDKKALDYLVKRYLWALDEYAKKDSPHRVIAAPLRTLYPKLLVETGQTEALKPVLDRLKADFFGSFPEEMILFALDPQFLIEKSKEHVLDVHKLDFDLFLNTGSDAAVAFVASDFPIHIPDIQLLAIYALAKQGPKAKSAADALRAKLKSNNPRSIAIAAGFALLAIDAPAHRDFVFPKLRAHLRVKDPEGLKYLDPYFKILNLKDEISKKKLVELLAYLAQSGPVTKEWLTDLGPSYAPYFRTYFGNGSNHTLTSSLYWAAKDNGPLARALKDKMVQFPQSDVDLLFKTFLRYGITEPAPEGK